MLLDYSFSFSPANATLFKQFLQKVCGVTGRMENEERGRKREAVKHGASVCDMLWPLPSFGGSGIKSCTFVVVGIMAVWYL